MSQRSALPNSTAASSSRLWPGDDDVVPAVERRRSNRWRLDSPHAEHGTRRVPAPRSARRSRSRRAATISRSFRPGSSANAAAYSCRLVAVVADAERRRRTRRPGSRARSACPTRRGCPCHRTPRRGCGRSGIEHVVVLDRLGDLAPAQLDEVLDAEVGVVARQVDDRRPRLGTYRDGTSLHTPPEITGRISTVSSSVEQLVAGHEGAVADHEVRLPVQLELLEQRPARARARRSRPRDVGCAAAPSWAVHSGTASADHGVRRWCASAAPLGGLALCESASDRPDRDELAGLAAPLGRGDRLRCDRTSRLTKRRDPRRCRRAASQPRLPPRRPLYERAARRTKTAGESKRRTTRP